MFNYMKLLGKFLKLKADMDDLQSRYDLISKAISEKTIDKMLELAKVPEETKQLRNQNRWLRKKLRTKDDTIQTLLKEPKKRTRKS